MANHLPSGPVTPEIGNLSKLEDPHLNDNLLSGFIPPEVGRTRTPPLCAGFGFTEYILLTAALVTRRPPGASAVAGPGSLHHVPPPVRRRLRVGNLLVSWTQTTSTAASSALASFYNSKSEIILA